MKKVFWAMLLAAGMGLLMLASAAAAPAPDGQLVQVATVTGTPEGPMILVPEQVNVRIGPGIDYDQVGVLISGQEATALGRSPGGDWIQIVYPGVPGNVAWVYAPFVVLEQAQGLLPIVEPPATATPRVTATIDPTLAAQFSMSNVPATRLPTYTPAAQVAQPTLDFNSGESGGAFPPVLLILGLLTLGLIGLTISLLRGY